MITHACVRYEDDHCQAIVPVSYVKDFKPKGLSDFDDRAKYSVRWTCGDGDSDDEDDQESYYKARILLLGGKWTFLIFLVKESDLWVANGLFSVK